jgi:hypothetical protein
MELNTVKPKNLSAKSREDSETALSCLCGISKSIGFVMKEAALRGSDLLFNVPDVVKLCEHAAKNKDATLFESYVYDAKKGKITAKTPLKTALAVMNLLRTLILPAINLSCQPLASICNFLEFAVILPLSVVELFMKPEKLRAALKEPYGALKLACAITFPLIFATAKAILAACVTVNVGALIAMSAAMAALRYVLEKSAFSGVLAISEGVFGIPLIARFRRNIAGDISSLVLGGTGAIENAISGNATVQNMLSSMCRSTPFGLTPCVFLACASTLGAILSKVTALSWPIPSGSVAQLVKKGRNDPSHDLGSGTGQLRSMTPGYLYR